MGEKEIKAKFKKGDKVFADILGNGVILDSYFGLGGGERLYHIEQGENTLGNVPESWIEII